MLCDKFNQLKKGPQKRFGPDLRLNSTSQDLCNDQPHCSVELCILSVPDGGD